MISRLGPFLYRRLARWVWCEFRPFADRERTVRLRSKWDVSSFQEVFCHPHYWQALAHLTRPPRLVVDAGAHCGHFCVLADVCAAARFPDAPPPRFVLVEPNPHLRPVLARTLADAGLTGRATVHQGLVGGPGDRGTLWVDAHNYLASGTDQKPGRTAVECPVLDLDRLLPPGPIDMLKLDVEGAEFPFVEHHAALLGRVGLLAVEVHAGRERYENEFVQAVARCGMTPCGAPMTGHFGYQLATFRRA